LQNNPIAATLMGNHPSFIGQIGDVLVVCADETDPNDTDITILDVAAMLEVAEKVGAGMLQASPAAFRTAWNALRRQWDGPEQAGGNGAAGGVAINRAIPIDLQTLPVLEHEWL
jgi:hypothetical protein